MSQALRMIYIHLLVPFETRLARAKLIAVARLRGERLRIVTHHGARLSVGTRLWAKGGGVSLLEVGARTVVESGVLLRFNGGSIILREDVQVRSAAILNVAGHLELQGNNLISWGSVIHCADRVVFEPRAGTGEMVTVVDSDHVRTDPGAHWYHNAVHAPVRIGSNSWLAAKSTVTRGVTIGSGCTVAANSVVRSDLPSGSVAAGVPATIRSGRGQAEVEEEA